MESRTKLKLVIQLDQTLALVKLSSEQDLSNQTVALTH